MANDEIILKERLHNYLEKYVKKAKLTSPKFSITNASNKGDNYIGLVYRITIENSENDEIKKKRFIIKTRRITLMPGKSIQFSKLFQRESFFYQEVLPAFRETLKEHCGIIERFPIFYDAENENGKEVITIAK